MVYANERNESLLSNCRVQIIFCKDYANERNESYFQIAQMQVYQVTKVGNICEPNKFIMVHK